MHAADDIGIRSQHTHATKLGYQSCSFGRCMIIIGQAAFFRLRAQATDGERDLPASKSID
jgi:hypothetical protein